MSMDRRAFLKSAGLIGATSLVSCEGAPLQTLYSYLTPHENMVPGLAYWYATVCRGCPAGCGLLVRTREGRPVKLEGNPEHPVNRGALCARGQAFVQGLYGRHRIRRPLVRQDGELVPSSWEEALAVLGPAMSSARSAGFISALESGAFEDLLAEFLAGFPEVRSVVCEPLAPVSFAKAAGIAFGREEVPEIDLTGVDYVLSVGADFLDAWLSPVKLSRQWAAGHGFAAGRTLRMEYAGPRRNLTANAADRWHRLAADGAVPLLRGVAARLLEQKSERVPASTARIAQDVLARLAAPESFSLEAAELDRIVSQLARAERGLVLFGGADVLTSHATAGHLLALLINHMTGSVGSAVRFGEGSAWSKADGADRALALCRAAGELDLLFVHAADPVGVLPDRAAMEKTSSGTRIVALAWERSATTEVADVVLPVHHPLEAWGDYEVNKRVIGLMQPVRQPLYDSRHAGDVLIQLAASAGRPLRRSEFKQYVIARRGQGPVFGSGGRRVPGEAAGATAAAVLPAWEDALVQGGEFLPQPSRAESLTLDPRAPERLQPLGTTEIAHTGPLLITPAAAALHDGRCARSDWLLEVPDTLTQTAWEIPLELAPDVALANGIGDGDLVRVSTQSGALTAKAFVNSGLVADTVALRLGGGSGFTREAIASGNVVDLLAPVFDPHSGEIARVQTRATLEKIGHEPLTSVMGSARSEGRFLYLTVALGAARAGHFPRLTRHGDVQPDDHGHVHGEPLPLPHDEVAAEGERPGDNMVELQRHPEHRWGLVVDLDLCTGCGACVVACYAENNVPVVGALEVRRGRELSWLRLEKHVFGEGPHERWRFLPVMCQHCDNAPCEPVCPAFAAVHTADGLNAQIYNRCVGTRYCSNNCPYKVRRFNYFDYERELPAAQQLNPDVTVRSRGVMEKCTFCVQRIREVTNRAKTDGRPVRDGEIVPACAQSCPTGALTFGDFKQQDSLMSRRARDPRAYRLLDYVTNTRPGVVYLRKVECDDERV